MANYEVVHFDDIDGIECPCGLAKRAFADADDSPASLHVVEIQADSNMTAL